jgi:hypothetical protein
MRSDVAATTGLPVENRDLAFVGIFFMKETKLSQIDRILSNTVDSLEVMFETLLPVEETPISGGGCPSVKL